MKPLRVTGALGQNTIPTTTNFVTITTWDENDTSSDCPFTACRKFTSKIYDPDGEFATAENGAPQTQNGTLYIDTSNSDKMYVNQLNTIVQAADFVTSGDNLTCTHFNSFLINAFTDGASIAGKIASLYDGNSPTVANGGATNDGACGDPNPGNANITFAEFCASVEASFATGVCHTATAVVTADNCSIASTYTLDTDASLDNLAAETSYPSDAPTTFTP